MNNIFNFLWVLVVVQVLACALTNVAVVCPQG